jgi:haloacetate dehalogenase
MRGMFPGFEQRSIVANGVRLNVRLGGDGPPLLLVHGYPQTSAMWHAVAPGLASRFSVVAPDLRGYGASEAPPADASHDAYNKRTMARDLVELMRGLGYERFNVAGHDRGARVTYRLALDHPDAVIKGATLDVIPTLTTWEAMDWRGAIGSFHWALLAQPAPIPERLIGGDPDFWLHTLLKRWAAPGFVFDGEAVAEYERAFRRADVIHGTCEDYRAGASVDVENDRADRGVRKIEAPWLAMWGDRDGRRPGLLDAWKEWATDVRGLPAPCGHFIAEEAPALTVAAFLEFFGDD